MLIKKSWGPCIAGLCAGIVNGLFGAGGGMALIPLLCILPGMKEDEVFSSSVAIILPICIVSLALILPDSDFPFLESIPYLIGSFAGGFLAYTAGKKIPTKWLHRLLGIFIIWGGIRYLC